MRLKLGAIRKILARPENRPEKGKNSYSVWPALGLLPFLALCLLVCVQLLPEHVIGFTWSLATGLKERTFPEEDAMRCYLIGKQAYTSLESSPGVFDL